MTVISQRFHDRLSERMLNAFFIQISLSHVHPQSSYEHWAHVRPDFLVNRESESRNRPPSENPAREQ